MHKLRILISGQSPIETNFNEGESLGEVLSRLESDGLLAARKISTFYVDGKPVANVHDVVLQDGMTVAGAPKVEGGNA